MEMACVMVLSADHCRIGSLEIFYEIFLALSLNHCRIGSLESWQEAVAITAPGSLPHRQLRKVNEQLKALSEGITAA